LFAQKPSTQAAGTAMSFNGLTDFCRFTNSEKWRKEFGTDDLAANFEYPEKEKVFEYYPQYYHKTDKVGFSCFIVVRLSKSRY
jgi:hypothetical protein